MLLGYNPVLQAVLGTFLTWGLTAAGSALVFVFSSGQVSCLQFLLFVWVEIQYMPNRILSFLLSVSVKEA